jgi:hypothetical protein
MNVMSSHNLMFNFEFFHVKGLTIEEDANMTIGNLSKIIHYIWL